MSIVGSGQSWELREAQSGVLVGPYTFYCPSNAIIHRVAIGEHVKLIFALKNPLADEPDAERMWVEVKSRDTKGNFTGYLDNSPIYIKDLTEGEQIEFRDVHIINTEHSEENIVDRYTARCFVSRRILYEGERVGYLYREEPECDDDSGWRVIAGYETGDYLSESGNTHYVSLGAVLNKDDSFLELLESPVGAYYRRNRETGEFEVDEDEWCVGKN